MLIYSACNPEVTRTRPALQDDPNFVEGNLKHSINGFMFCNMPPVSTRECRFSAQSLLRVHQLVSDAICLSAPLHTRAVHQGYRGHE